MIPIDNIDVDSENGVEVVEQPSLSYKMSLEKEQIRNYIDGIEAVKQAIYKILMTDRYEYSIYTWNYGIEINDLIGKPKDYAKAILSERIKDALLPDDRILEVVDFIFTDIDKTTLGVQFTAITTYGKAEIKWQVNTGV